MEIRRVGILGAGTMGRGIAAAIVHKGIEVLLCEKDTELAQAALAKIAEDFDHEISRWAITDTDKEALRALGVLEVDQAPNPVLEASVPDSLIPVIAALPGVQFVRATGWGCAAPARGERMRRP